MTGRPLLGRGLTTAGDLDPIQAGPVAAVKPLRFPTRPPPAAAPDRATPGPRGAEERRNG